MACGLAALLGGLFLSPAPSAAKRVVCVGVPTNNMGELQEDGYISNKEGYERSQNAAGDVVRVAGSLTDCLGEVASGDTLVIIAHGLSGGGGNGSGFRWNDQAHTGFGTGPGELPPPPGFDTLENVKVEFCACWSANDPDGAGDDLPLTEKILEALGGNQGNAATGFVGTAKAEVDVLFPIPMDLNGDQETAYQITVNSCLEAGRAMWENLPPESRSDPAPEPNQKSKALELIATCFEKLPPDDPVFGQPPPSDLLLDYREATDSGAGGNRGRGETICGETGFTVNGLFFYDGFESGGTGVWTSCSGCGGS